VAGFTLFRLSYKTKKYNTTQLKVENFGRTMGEKSYPYIGRKVGNKIAELVTKYMSLERKRLERPTKRHQLET
jgi:hypothetical protein